MKPEEAIKIFKSMYFVSANGANNGERETVEFTIKALEKQVAKKPRWEGPHNEAKDDAIPYCSTCDTKLEEDWNNCPECGKAIDWSEE